MYKGETPTLAITLKQDVDFEEVKHIIATFTTDNRKIVLEKTEDDMTIDDGTILLSFTQEETLSFPSKMLMQINFLFYDGTRLATNVVNLRFDHNLKPEVLSL